MSAFRLDAGCIAIDARCLQDPDYADRGIGRHAAQMLKLAPPGLCRTLIGLADPLLPPLRPEFRDLFHAVRPNVLAHELRAPGCVLSLSPMTHDPLFTARLLDDPSALKAAIVYDFIPFDWPERYLTRGPERHAYYERLYWLGRHDLFLPISGASAARMQKLLGTVPACMAVTGAALAPVFETGERLPAAHILVAGGNDVRKNVECAIRAHANPVFQAAGLPLVITGTYTAAEEQALRRVAVAAGGNPVLVCLPGHVPDLALRTLYAESLCVIAPSRDEGFDLPVIEAMAAGAPVVASDIPAHRELVRSGAWRFGSDDPGRLGALILTLLRDPAARAAVLAEQDAVWPRFRGAAVAERFWGALQDRLLPALASPPVLRGRRPRLALLSPVPPDRSGVADYSAATCAALGEMTELHVFAPTAAPAPVPGAASVRPLSAQPSLSRTFDRVVAVLGNSPFHSEIFRHLLRYGGACIGHDGRMLDFYCHRFGADAAAALASRELGRLVGPAEIGRWLQDEATLDVTLYEEIAAASDPLMLHNPATARLVRERFGTRPIVLPFSVYRTWQPQPPAARQAARHRLGLPDGQVVIATFGFVHHTKAPGECLWALSMLRGWGIDAALHFVGGIVGTSDMLERAAALGMAGQVRLLGRYVSEETYDDYLLAADLGVQLRLTGLGSISGALQDCIAAGLPTVANAALADAVDAPAYVSRVPDALSPVLIAEALAGLLDAGLARTRPETARLAYVSARSPRRYAERLCAALGLEPPG